MLSINYYLLVLSIFVHKFLGKSKSGKSTYVNSLRNIDSLVEYSKICMNDYKKYMSKESYGRILEIGTGSNFLVPFRLTDFGEYVKTIDKFNCLINNFDLYKNLNLPSEELDSLEQFLIFDGKKFGGGSINYEVIGLEEYSSLKPYDLIVSRAVFEHLDDVEACFKSLSSLLSKDGEMIHEIDFRDHGLFTHFGLSAGFFYSLTEEDWQRGLILAPGLPNRLSSNDFFQLFSKYFPSKQIIMHVKINTAIKDKYLLLDKSRDNRVVVFHIK
jgi:hypothetical protein